MNVSIASFTQSIFVIIVQLYWILKMINSTDNNLLKLLIFTASPFIVVLTSFFIYYSINTIYNIFVPRGLD